MTRIIRLVDAGVVGGCGDLCQALLNKTNSQAAGIACNLLCDVVGVKEFMAIVEKLVDFYRNAITLIRYIVF